MVRRIVSQPQHARVFFFRHPLEPMTDRHLVPGRVRYDAGGTAIMLQERAVRPWAGFVYADGFASNERGPNVDPNVFSDVIPWHLSFCRIDNRKEKNWVAGRNGEAMVLSEVVRSGSVIVFGDHTSPHAVWIDTVMCVERVVELPTDAGGVFALQERFDEYWGQLENLAGPLRWHEFARTMTFKVNLEDTLPSGAHATTKVLPHRQIVGRRRVPADTRRDALSDAILAGEGFNFIPLGGAQASTSVRTRPGLLSIRVRDLGRLFDENPQRKVHPLPAALGTELIKQIIDGADTLILDPIKTDGIQLSPLFDPENGR